MTSAPVHSLAHYSVGDELREFLRTRVRDAAHAVTLIYDLGRLGAPDRVKLACRECSGAGACACMDCASIPVCMACLGLGWRPGIRVRR